MHSLGNAQKKSTKMRGFPHQCFGPKMAYVILRDFTWRLWKRCTRTTVVCMQTRDRTQQTTGKNEGGGCTKIIVHMNNRKQEECNEDRANTFGEST